MIRVNRDTTAAILRQMNAYGSLAFNLETYTKSRRSRAAEGSCGEGTCSGESEGKARKRKQKGCSEG